FFFEVRSRHTREMGVTLHVTHYPDPPHRGRAIDARTTRPPGYAISQRKRNSWSKPSGDEDRRPVTRAPSRAFCLQTSELVAARRADTQRRHARPLEQPLRRHVVTSLALSPGTYSIVARAPVFPAELGLGSPCARLTP